MRGTLDDRCLKAAFAQILGRFESDEAATDDGGPLRLRGGDEVGKREGVFHRAEEEDAW